MSDASNAQPPAGNPKTTPRGASDLRNPGNTNDGSDVDGHDGPGQRGPATTTLPDAPPADGQHD